MAAAVAVLGTLVPSATYYQSAVHLSGGILAFLLSLVPLFTLPVAWCTGFDRPGAWRLMGLALGIAGVVPMIGPEARLPETGIAAWIPLALVAPAFYAIEGNVVARSGTTGLEPVTLLFLASLLGIPFAALIAPATGQFIDPPTPWRAPDAARAMSAAIHVLAYSAYVWLVGRAGSVFSAQVSYLVIGFGVLWSIALLGKSYSGYVWAALAAMFAGVALVQPRPPLAALAVRGDCTGRRLDGTP